VKNAFQIIKDARFRSLKASSTKHACDVKDRRERKHRNQKGKHDRQVAQDGVFANRMNPQNRPRSAFHINSHPPNPCCNHPTSKARYTSHSSKIKEAHENETRRFESGKSKIQWQAQLLSSAPLPWFRAQQPSQPPSVPRQLGHLPVRHYLKMSKG